MIHVDPSDMEEIDFWEANNDDIAIIAKNSFAVDRVVALVCQNFTCSSPVTDPVSLEALLSSKSP